VDKMKKILNVLIILCLIAFVIYFVKRDEERELAEEIKKIVISVNDRDLVVELENNSSADYFYERLKKESITVNAKDNGNYEKVAELEFDVPRNDKTIETKPGDLILYQGNKIALYYDTNKYSFTKLGHVTNLDSYELKDLLGKGDTVLKYSIKY
jgi:hypothetical protein